MTLKSHLGTTRWSALRRGEAEFQCDDDEFRNLMKPGKVAQEFKNRLKVDIECGRLTKVLTLKTKRKTLDLRTRVNPYKFSHDLFYYILHEAPGEPEFSEYNAEIEIELKGHREQADTQLEKLRAGISSLLLYASNQKSKFQRGLEWILRRTESAQHVYVISFGLFEFFARPDQVQKQQIQILNHHVKEVLREIQGKTSEDDLSLIYLATGEGMTLVVEESPEDLIRLVRRIQERLRPGGEPLRVGLHAGPVFKYSDVNESLSYAGNGISLARRLMELGDAWHVLASDSMLQALREAGCDEEFCELQPALGEVRVFNVFDDSFGNPSVPQALRPL